MQARVPESRKSPNDSQSSSARRQKEMHVKADEVWTVTLKKLELYRPRKVVLGTPYTRDGMACPNSLKEWRLPHGILVSSGAEI